METLFKEPTLITVHCAHEIWKSRDGNKRGYEVVIEHNKVLSKVTTYDDSLTKHGMVHVEFYKHPQLGMRCIRKG